MGRKKKIKAPEPEVKTMTEENTAVMEENKITEELIEDTVEQPVEDDVNEKYSLIESANQELDQVRKDLEKAKIELEAKQTEMKLMKVRRELDEQEIAIMNKQISNGNEVQAKLSALEKQKAFDNVKVTGKFLNQRYPGQTVKLPYVKYATDEAKWYTFQHNKVYTIPRGFADQINEHYARITYTQKENNVISNPDNPGTALENVPVRHQLYAFVPNSF
jgi:hypothetical protein